MGRRGWTCLVGSSAVFPLLASWTVALAQAPQRELDWTTVNPAFAGATFVKDPDVCATCHDEAMPAYRPTAHGRAFAAKPPARTGDCESCHGPRSKHVEAPSKDNLSFAAFSPAEQTAVCQQCHQGGARMSWKTGGHATADVSCTSCHTVMSNKSDRSLLARPREQDLCVTCHADVRAELVKASHHPIREGRLACSSCHNAHGAQSALLKTSTVNETCVSCHTEKRGPFVWEHAPVREGCTSCHQSHGSNNRHLLARKDPFLCLACHSYGGHINLPRYNRVSTPYGSGCVNCHITTHGSNHPSGAKFTR